MSATGPVRRGGLTLVMVGALAVSVRGQDLAPAADDLVQREVPNTRQ